MKSYKIITGDTFELISRKQYGTETEATRIRHANPGVIEPFVAGTVIVIPDIPAAPVNKAQNTESSNDDEVALLIDGKRFRFWSEVQITRSIDNIDSIEFSAPFEPGNPEFKNTFKPFSFKSIEVTVGGNIFFSGTMVNIVPNQAVNNRTVQVSGYSKPGVLSDCNFPASTFPNEFNKQTLEDIATTTAGIFGLNVVFSADAGPVFERIYCDTHTKILSFLSNLAKQRNLIINSTPEGDLQFLQSVDPGGAIGQLIQGVSPLISITPSFSPQEYYSHITGMSPTVVGIEGSQYTVKNSHLTTVLRPYTFDVNDSISSETETSVRAKTSRMFASAIKYNVEVATWRSPNGDLWLPNTTIKIQAPGAMIYEPYEFLIKSVTFRAERSGRIASLSLVLPGAFSGGIPVGLPWD